MTLTPAPGDVFAVRTNDIGGRLIRLGAAIRYLFRGGNTYGDLDNHIVIVIHQTDGVFWGIEGKPGGVGWADLTRYINDPCTITNEAQPKTDEQRTELMAVVPQVLGKSYDWGAIMASAAADLHLPQLFRDNWKDQGVPGHFICSSLADYLYGRVGLASPKADRYCQPSDWVGFIRDEGWK